MRSVRNTGTTRRGVSATADGTIASHEPQLRSARAGVVQLGMQGVRFALMLGSGIVLARLLTPTEFGRWAVIASLRALADGIRGAGVLQALLRAPGSSFEGADQGRRRALRVALVTAATLVTTALLAPLLPFATPIDAALLLAAAPAVLGPALTIDREAWLVRTGRVGRLARIEIAATLLGAAAAIVAAWRGVGPWSLWLQLITTAACRLILLARVADARSDATRHTEPDDGAATPEPGRPTDPGRTDDALAHYSRDFVRTQLLLQAGRLGDRFVVAALLGPTALGHYDTAARWPALLVDQVTSPLSSVMIATLGRQTRTGDLDGVRASLLGPTALVLPALAWLALEARWLLGTLLGSVWLPAAPVLQALCVAGMAGLLVKLVRWICLATADVQMMVRWSYVTASFTSIAALVTAPYGVDTVARAVAGASVAAALAALGTLRNHRPPEGRAVTMAFVFPLVATAAATGVRPALRLASSRGTLADDIGTIGDMLSGLAVFGSAYLAALLLHRSGRSLLWMTLHALTTRFR